MTAPGARAQIPLPPIEVLRDPAFTPSRKMVPALIELAAGADEALARAAAAALARAQSPVVGRIVTGLEARDATARARLTDALRFLAGRGEDDAVVDACEAALSDADARVRKAAARGLGKVGGERARAALAKAASSEGDARASRSIDRSRSRLDRDAARRERSVIDLAARLGATARVAFRCRRGLEPTLLGEIGERVGRGARAVEPGRVEMSCDLSLAELYAARTALDVSFVVALDRAAGDPVEAAIDLISSPGARAILRAFTRGPIRYRLAWPSGKRRAATAAVTVGVRERSAGAITDDPRASAWDILVDDDGRRALFCPRVDDPRFAYRVADVPAASHPTIAAALAREGGARPDDVVWDPFVGSGLELCERALLGPARRLIGTDVDRRAIERAAANLTSVRAGGVELSVGDARHRQIDGVTLVITNPPMGRRLVRGPALDELLTEALWQVARALAPGGRVVLLSPRPTVTRDALVARGLLLREARAVDLGGYEAVLQRFEKPLLTAGARRGARAART